MLSLKTVFSVSWSWSCCFCLSIYSHRGWCTQQDGECFTQSRMVNAV